MSKTIHQRHWLYLLVAVFLSIQSMAIWHGAIHPFHIANAQCVQLAAIGHVPSDLPTPLASPFFTLQFIEIATIDSIISIHQQLENNHLIRAPPLFL